MTYQICYVPKDAEENSRGYCMFDIEYYIKETEKKNGWYSEVHCLLCVEGLTHFLKDAFDNKHYDYERFIHDAEEIQEIRGLLYEQYDNKPKPFSEINAFHYHVFGKVLKEKVYDFADMYGCYVNID